MSWSLSEQTCEWPPPERIPQTMSPNMLGGLSQGAFCSPRSHQYTLPTGKSHHRTGSQLLECGMGGAAGNVLGGGCPQGLLWGTRQDKSWWLAESGVHRGVPSSGSRDVCCCREDHPPSGFLFGTLLPWVTPFSCLSFPDPYKGRR